MLHVLAQSNAARVRTDGNIKLRSHEQYCDDFVHAAQTTAINLAKAERTCLQELLEHYSILAMLAGRNTNGRYGSCNLGMTQHVIRTRRLFNPERAKARQLSHTFYRLAYVPHLIGIHHQRAIPAYLFAYERGTLYVFVQIAPDFHLELCPAVADALAYQAAYFLVRISKPSGCCSVSSKPFCSNKSCAPASRRRI